MTTGEKIKAARKARGWTQGELGDRAGMFGSAVRKYELGKGHPKIETLRKIGNALGVDWKDLLEDSEPPKKITKQGTMSDIEQLIGTPATLEQLAEECAELGQAALKLARKMRGENPTPKTQDELMENLTEEVADVLLCIEQVNLDACMIVHIKAYKTARWRQRIEDMNHDGE